MNIRIPEFAKETFKYLISADERKRIHLLRRIRRQQNEAILQFDASAKKLIVFLVTGTDRRLLTDKISGGIISIVSLCQESAELKAVHDATVIMCTLPNDLPLFRHTQFVNHTPVFRFDQLETYFLQAKEIILHIPEFTCDYFLEYLPASGRRWLKGFQSVHINILNQNIRLMPERSTIEKLKQLANKVTATTAHQRYCSPAYRQQYDIPLHKFSVWISPEKYAFKEYAEKENLLIVSPDVHPMKEEILSLLSEIPGLTIQIIRNLTYETYKSTISRAKWAMTFGEGLDGYILEPIFSGAIGFAVYNEEFFTPDFKTLDTIYTSYASLKEDMVSDMKRLDHENEFVPYQRNQFAICAAHYSEDVYRKNIAAFYQGNYTLP